MVAPLYLEVEGVKIVDLPEGEYAGEGEEEVEAEDEKVVPQDQVGEVLLPADGGDEGGQAVVTHEAVHAHPEQVGQPGYCGGGGWGASSRSLDRLMQARVTMMMKAIHLKHKNQYLISKL